MYCDDYMKDKDLDPNTCMNDPDLAHGSYMKDQDLAPGTCMQDRALALDI